MRVVPFVWRAGCVWSSTDEYYASWAKYSKRPWRKSYAIKPMVATRSIQWSHFVERWSGFTVTKSILQISVFTKKTSCV